jgi:CheY-like chemotaxis protein
MYEINQDVPEHIIGDPLRLRQVFMNLVSNAVKFTPSGEVNIKASLKPSANIDQLNIAFEVKDTGIGIAADKTGRLFKAFSQVDASTTRKYGGTGLGLVICEKLVGLMGGSINVSSIPGVGTSFTFNILSEVAGSIRNQWETSILSGRPVTGDIANTAGAGQQTSSKLSSDFADRYPMRILVAEDNPVNQMLILKMLEMLGYLASIAENGQLAVAMSATNSFDLIFMDVQMPEMDGLEATKTIRQQQFPQPFIVAMTANVMEGDREECIKAGMDDYLSKPINVDDLIAMLKKWASANRTT